MLKVAQISWEKIDYSINYVEQLGYLSRKKKKSLAVYHT